MIGKLQVKKWFEECKKEGKRFLIIVCDTFSWEDFQVFSDSPTYTPSSMQQVMDVYDTTLSIDNQIDDKYKKRIGI